MSTKWNTLKLPFSFMLIYSVILGKKKKKCIEGNVSSQKRKIIH